MNLFENLENKSRSSRKLHREVNKELKQENPKSIIFWLSVMPSFCCRLVVFLRIIFWWQHFVYRVLGSFKTYWTLNEKHQEKCLWFHPHAKIFSQVRYILVVGQTWFMKISCLEGIVLINVLVLSFSCAKMPLCVLGILREG